ncbi:hypothetical protein [Flectobacillus sp. BAB-3569]|uniref:hypothetical protein n=1 Tax=Flectobacillus sp. BAB-3569 TaxID=1509483 RepID=UPI000BA4AEC4|nr:hypothetical protein [Flectobacillus sp. BAB-3569]PAC28761.1 hypothetical protein BWI92_19520 [Flectobacillus sp. BAB-3569]
MSYKYQIKLALLRKNWEIVEIRYSEEWWDDENWKIQYRFNSAIFLYLCFITDPMFEGNRKKGQGIIYEIKATTKFPQNWNDDSNTIALIQMSKGKFDLKL